MAYKTILVHCDAGRTSRRLDKAVALAERHQAHLIGLHARPPFQPPVYDNGSFAMEMLFKDHERQSPQARRSRLDSLCHGREGQQHQLRMALRGRLCGCAAGASCALCRPDHRRPNRSRGVDGLPLPSDLPESVALATGRGMLVVPFIGAPKTIGGNVLLCWNASRESARAASEALPLLKAASTVTVLIVEPRSTAEGMEPSRAPTLRPGSAVMASR